ncbi:MAG: hypothetical protein M3424_05155 [Actinomycetota bacterium]|nr:hypothetical protein [Actinomycetota bacterium]
MSTNTGNDDTRPNPREAGREPDDGLADRDRDRDAYRDDRDRDAYRDDRHTGAVAADSDRDLLAEREKEAYGGIKFGSAFFGWLTATGMAVLLIAILAAAGTAVGLTSSSTVDDAVAGGGQDAQTVGLIGGIVLLVILFIAYYCGGYVAGRMARFNGTKQGLAVWLWALLIAVLVAVLGLVAGTEFDVLAQVNAFPRIPVSEGDLTTGGIIVALAVALASLAGALLGGKAGMRFHRKVDEVGLGH